MFSSQSLPPPGWSRHPWSRRKIFQCLGEVERARCHGPPKPFSLSIINTNVAFPHSQQPCHGPDWLCYRVLPCRTPAQLSVPTHRSGARLAPLRKLPAVILAVAACPVQAVNRPAYQRQFIGIPSTPNPIVSPHSAAAPLNGKFPFSSHLAFAASLHAEVWLLHPLKYRVRDRSPGHLIPY